MVTMQAGGEGGAREKQPSPLKKLLKRINPKKKKARKKKTRGAKVERGRKGDPGIGWGAPSEGPERRRR